MPPLSDQIIHTSFQSALEAGIGVPVAMSVRVTAFLQILYYDGIPHGRVRLRALADTVEIGSTPIREHQLVSRSLTALQEGLVLCARGRIVPHTERRPTRQEPLPFRLELSDLCELCYLDRPTALCGALPDEVAAADQKLDRLLQEPGAARAHIQTELRAIMGIEAPGSPLMQLCQDLVVLQALCHGQVIQQVNPRLSLYFYGHSAEDREVLAGMAELMAPLSSSISPAHAAPVDIASYAEVLGEQGWVARPGALPQATGGVCLVEDLHDFPQKALSAAQWLLVAAAEEGQVCHANQGTGSYVAQCGLLLTSTAPLLLRSVLREPERHLMRPRRALGPYVPFEALSRMDILACLDETPKSTHGVDPQARLPVPGSDGKGEGPKDQGPGLSLVAELPDEDEPFVEEPEALPRRRGELADAHVLRRKALRNFGQAERQRALKVLLCRLVERIPEVSMEGVYDEARALIQRLAAQLKADTEGLDESHLDVLETDGILLRMAHTARKLIGASARLAGRDRATPEDVECTFRMLSLSLHTVRAVADETRMGGATRKKKDTLH